MTMTSKHKIIGGFEHDPDLKGLKRRPEIAYTHHEALREVDRLRAQKAALLEALKRITAGMWAGDGSTNPRVRGAEVKAARAAIAAAEGETT